MLKIVFGDIYDSALCEGKDALILPAEETLRQGMGIRPLPGKRSAAPVVLAVRGSGALPAGSSANEAQAFLSRLYRSLAKAIEGKGYRDVLLSPLGVGGALLHQDAAPTIVTELNDFCLDHPDIHVTLCLPSEEVAEIYLECFQRIKRPDLRALLGIAIDHYVDKNPTISLQNLRQTFPWINVSLAEEEAVSWVERGLMVREGDVLRRTEIRPNAKLLFLDIDGVLNHVKGDAPIDTDCLRNLKKVVDATGAEIILISSWRLGWSKDDKSHQSDDADYLDSRLAVVGLSVMDKASIHTGTRTYAVADWVMRTDASSFAILDDEGWQYQDGPLADHLVATEYLNGGLTEELAERAIGLLNR